MAHRVIRWGGRVSGKYQRLLGKQNISRTRIAQIDLLQHNCIVWVSLPEWGLARFIELLLEQGNTIGRRGE